jgi:TPP-dependent pyruvate/acetoin dehydrogenase alpha subunit
MTDQSPTAKLRMMKLIRAFEEALAARPDHGFQLISSGEEAVAVGLCSSLAPQDQLLTGGRSIGPALARGVDPSRLMAELLGRSSGTNKGKGGRGHIADPASGFFGAHAVVGGNISIAAGVALALQMSGKDAVAVILFGDGAFGAGALHETLNIAASMKLPLLFVCNNNQLSVSTPRSSALAPARLSDIGIAFGIPSQTVDGMDLDTVSTAISDALKHVRAKKGPAFVECVSYRFSSHSTTARETRSREELAEIRALCPIVKQSRKLKEAGTLNGDTEHELDRLVADTVGAALKFSDASAMPREDEALQDVI